MHGDPETLTTAVAGTPETLRERLRADPAALGELLLVVGSGPIPVIGALGGILALDSSGAAVLIAIFSSIPSGAPGMLADELDRLALHGGKKLAQIANEAPGEGSIAQAHRALFEPAKPKTILLNTRQRAIVVAESALGIDTWKDLKAELGPKLSGAYLAEGDLLIALPLPQTLQKQRRVRSFWRWMAAAVVVSLLGGVWIGRSWDRNSGVAGDRPLISRTVLVAPGVPADATHTQWIGQRRLVHTSDGHLIAAYADPGGLELVTDKADQGRSWGGPQAVAAIHPSSTFTIAIDDGDRLHVAFRDHEGVGYANLTKGASGWEAGPIVRLDGPGKSPVVDMAFDSAHSIAHVVWVKGDPKQQPWWASVRAPEGRDPTLDRSEALADPGDSLSVLVNVGVSRDGRVIATYRRGDSVTGWFARYLDGATPGAAWAPEEALPVADALYGAGTLAVDPGGIAHVVLRDNTTYGLTYLSRAPGGQWSTAETIVDADKTEQIDFPSVSVDTSSGTVFVVYQDTTKVPEGEIKAVSKAVEGWSPPEVVTTGQFPTSIERASGLTVVLSTSPAGSLGASRVAAG